MSARPTIVVEDDVALRLLGVVLDPDTAPERRAAFADYVAHDVPDFEGWASGAVAAAPGLFPARVIPVADGNTLRAALPEAAGVVVEELVIGRDELALCPCLAFVQKFGTVLRNVDVAACRARGVAVLTRRRRTNVAVAEHAMAMLMALAKRLNGIGGRVDARRLTEAGFAPTPYETRHTPNANWGRVPGLRTLAGATLGLVGLGEIGREMARLGTGVGMEVLYFQRHRLEPAEEKALGIGFAAFEEVLARAEYVSLHVPKNARDLIDARAFALMRPGAVLINTARAAVVNRQALLDALRSGRIGGAAFDVLYEEPAAPDDPLLAMPNVLLTPHLAGGSRRNGLADLAEMLAGMSRALAAAR